MKPSANERSARPARMRPIMPPARSARLRAHPARLHEHAYGWSRSRRVPHALHRATWWRRGWHGAGSCVHLDRVADRFPAGVAAIHVLRIEAGIAQLDGRFAADVKAVCAVHDHRFGFRQLADPLLELLGIAPLDALGDILPAGDRRPRTHVDHLDGLAGGQHLLHLLHADALDVAEFGLLERPRAWRLGGILVAQLECGPIHVA